MEQWVAELWGITLQSKLQADATVVRTFKSVNMPTPIRARAK